MLMVWDLNPSVHIISPSIGRESVNGSMQDRPQPTAFVIPFAHPLTSVSSHPFTSKDLLVSDCRGSVFLTDWRSDPPDGDPDDCRHATVVELVEPRALADALSGVSVYSGMTSAAAWRMDNTDIIGAVYGSKFAVWDLSHLHGGKPTATGSSFSEGGHQFRWCPTFPEYFAISTRSPLKGAHLHIHNTAYINAQPATFTLAPRPVQIRDFDFLATPGVPQIAAAVGQEIVIFHIGVET